LYADAYAYNKYGMNDGEVRGTANFLVQSQRLVKTAELFLLLHSFAEPKSMSVLRIDLSTNIFIFSVYFYLLGIGPTDPRLPPSLWQVKVSSLRMWAVQCP
jgi:hypothetical protein